MGQVSVWVLCQDNIWYEEPVWEKLDGYQLREWYICVDDEDDPELVYFSESRPVIEFISPIKQPEKSNRLKGYTDDYKMIFADAMTVDVMFAGKPPKPQKYLSCSDVQPDYLGVYYA